MTEVINMPRLSDTMEEGVVSKWLKKVGDEINEGDILAEIETDKATMDFESFYSGKLIYIGVKEGESAKIDSILAVISTDDKVDIEQIIKNFNTKSKNVLSENQQEEKEPKETKPVESKSESVNKTLESKSLTKKTTRILISPLAKKMANEKGIELSLIKSGSGDNGRIVKKDIEAFKLQSFGVTFVSSGQEKIEEVTNSQMRKTIAKRLSQSKFTAPHYYLKLEINMNNAITFRTQFNSIHNTKISFNDVIIKSTALALKKFPAVNSSWTEQKTEIHHHIHIGVAVAIDDGLVVPVLNFADEMSLIYINSSVRELVNKARNKKLSPQEMEGSTFTISNLGMFGITEFTSIINQPNSAILSIGAIIQKPVVIDNKIEIGSIMSVTLACDHRIIDGSTGAQFLDTLKNYLENPIILLI